MQPLGLVHRDVSPRNILLSTEGCVKLTDFGIARARGMLDPPENLEDTRVRALHGRFNHMSPEQARGEPAEATSDVFSLGTVLYECITGSDPFAAPTAFETLRRAQNCEYSAVAEVRPDCPPTLAQIVTTAMAAEASQRFPNAGSMHAALLEFQHASGRRFSASDLADYTVRCSR